VFIDGVYHMWYTGYTGSNATRQIGYATSSDGINWEKYDDPATDEILYEESDPVLKPNLVEMGSVMVEGDSLRMWYAWYSGWFKICHATAPLNPSSGIDEFIDSALPQTFILNQNYPNPFNPTTVICYVLPVSSHVDLSIYNLLGHKIATLVSEKQPAGTFNVSWDASGLASGVYLYRLRAGNYSETKKLILLR
jgi:hypothetical protein